tara:strand:+ start:460 stop:615 length:156 start_codon:yes stop_codon:yes gene_type:complete
MVETARIERATCGLENRCSIQLSYASGNESKREEEERLSKARADPAKNQIV